jgi:hypothetical protein
VVVLQPERVEFTDVFLLHKSSAPCLYSLITLRITTGATESGLSDFSEYATACTVLTVGNKTLCVLCMSEFL